MEIEPDFVSGKGWYVELSELFQVHGRKLRVDEIDVALVTVRYARAAFSRVKCLWKLTSIVNAR